MKTILIRLTASSVLLLLMCTVTVSCKKNKKEDFDRKGMLTEMASLVIVPVYNDLHTSLSNLENAAGEFTTAPNSATLSALRSQYVEANKSFQRCSMYDFGPAMTYGIKASFNTFPTDTTKIEANIASGTYVLEDASNSTAIGFPALDYLLYASDEATIISKFSTDTYANERKNYLNDLVAKMKTEFQPVYDQWNGSYPATFIEADGNDVSSSCSHLLNEFVEEMELLKNAKIGIPSGELTGGQALPTYFEAYYSGISTTLIYENLVGLENCFTGGTGSGFDDYIRDVEGSDVSSSLADQIIQQFSVCKSLTSAVSNPLSATASTNPEAVHELYQEIKKLVIYCKTDMTALLGILITYQDNDGD